MWQRCSAMLMTSISAIGVQLPGLEGVAKLLGVSRLGFCGQVPEGASDLKDQDRRLQSVSSERSAPCSLVARTDSSRRRRLQLCAGRFRLAPPASDLELRQVTLVHAGASLSRRHPSCRAAKGG